jgi:hypothetical protein
VHLHAVLPARAQVGLDPHAWHPRDTCMQCFRTGMQVLVSETVHEGSAGSAWHAMCNAGLARCGA